MPMNPKVLIPALLGLCSLVSTGCGGKGEAENRRLRGELQQMEQRIMAARSELPGARESLAASKAAVAEQERAIGDLSAQVKDAEAANAARRAAVLRLESPEDTAFAEAEAAGKAGDKSKALASYRAFARDFPSSSRHEAAEVEARQLEKSIARDKWESEAPARARAAAAAQAARAQQDYAAGYQQGLGFGRVYENKLISEAQLDRLVNLYRRNARTSPDVYEMGFRNGFHENYWKGAAVAPR